MKMLKPVNILPNIMARGKARGSMYRPIYEKLLELKKGFYLPVEVSGRQAKLSMTTTLRRFANLDDRKLTTMSSSDGLTVYLSLTNKPKGRAR